MTFVGNSKTLLMLALAVAGCAAQTPEDGIGKSSSTPLWGKTSKLWDSGIVPVCWAQPGWETEKAWVRSAIARTWEAAAPGLVRFAWDSCTGPGQRVMLTIVDEARNPHSEGLGTENTTGNGVVMNFTFDNWEHANCSGAARQGCIEKIAIHEFGHVLGFAHEQNRSDTPVDALYQGTAGDFCINHPQGDNGDTIFTAWDMSSIMNYCNVRWNNDGVLSDGDKLGLLKAYGGRNTSPSSAPGTQFQADMNNDGYEDVFALYDYGANQMGVLVWNGSMNGLLPPWRAFLSSPGDWNWSLAKPVAGDFDGDGRADIAVLYDYGNDNTGLWVFFSTGSGFSAPQLLWWSGVGNWASARSKPVVGDFNGDGITDIAVFYDYGSDDTGLWTFNFRAGRRVDPPVQNWRSGAGNWRWSSIKPVSGHFVAGEGRVTDIMAFYDYGSSDTGSHLFRGSYWGLGAAPIPKWRSGAGNWAWSSSKFVAADFNGNGVTDIACLYDYGGSDAALWLFWESNGWPSQVWRSGAGNWYQPGTQIAAGRFAQGTAQMVGFYDYGWDTSAIWTFRGPYAGWAPVAQWFSGYYNWSAPRTKFF